MRSAVTCALASGLVVVFVLSALSKTANRRVFDDFADSLAQFGIRIRPVQRVVATGVIALEATLAGSLSVALTPATSRTLWVAVLLTVCGFVALLSAALAAASRTRATVQCHCFGTSDDTSLGEHLMENGSLITAAAVLIGLGTPRSGDPGTVVLGCGLGALAAIGFVYGSYTYKALSIRAAH